jgi:transposase-like protein
MFVPNKRIGNMVRRKHSPEFKKKIAIEALREQKTVNQIAKEHSVHPVQVSEWKKQLLDGCGSVFENRTDRVGRQTNREEEVAALERKVGRLTIELDFLKKKLEG